MPELIRKDATLRYEVEGSGPPVVFVSGWGLGKFCWAPTVGRLSRRFRCIAYDARGVGRSTAREGAAFDVETHADDLEAICEAEGAYDAHFVGHELGGRVAAIVARARPQYAATLTVVGWWGAADIRETVGGFERFRQATSLLLRDLGSYPLLRNVVARGFGRAPEPYRTHLFDEFARLDAGAAYQTALAAADPAAAAAFDAAVARLAIPTLLVQGGDDRDAARAGLRALFERLSHVDLATIHGAGPLPMLEFPDAFARTLESFFAEHCK